MFFELRTHAAVLQASTAIHRRRPRGVRRVPGLPDRAAPAVHPGGPHGEHVLAFVAAGPGPVEEGEAPQADPDVAPVVAEHVGPMPYPALNGLFDALVPAGLQHYWKANFVSELTDEAIAAHLEHGPKVPAVNSTMHIYPINGACHRVAPDATAFAYRDANVRDRHRGHVAGSGPERREHQVGEGLLRGDRAALRGGRLHQLHGRRRPGPDQDNYKGNYERLVRVKRRYDPDNLFHLNQNIKP